MTEETDNNPGAYRSWWRNCAVATDSEILAIDRLEDAISPVAPGVSRTRELISTLELCHHKAERWVANIVAAIASGDTAKGLGTRPAGATHPVERTWKSACTVLSGWCAGCPAGSVNLSGQNSPGLGRDEDNGRFLRYIHTCPCLVSLFPGSMSILPASEEK